MALQEFKINTEGYKTIFRRRMITYLVALGLVVVVVITMNTGGEKGSDWLFILPYLAIMAAIIGSGYVRARKRLRTFFESYTLSVTDTCIIREQHNTPPIMIYFPDIREIVKFRNGTIVIRGRSQVDTIFVPAQIDQAEILEARLRELRPFAPKSTSWMLRYGRLMGIPAIGLMVLVYTQTNKLVVLIAGSLLTVLIIWSFANIQRSKNVDRRARMSSWWVLIPMAMVIYIVVTRLLEK